MKRWGQRAVAAAAVATAVAGWPAPVGASSAQHNTTIRPSAQAWYWTVGCGSLVGCGVVAAPIDPFPAGALHVGVIAGVQFATAYLGFGDKAMPAGAQSSKATLTLPLATDPSAAVVNASSAQLEVCTTDELITSADYALSAPPPVNCRHGVLATYHGGAKPSFTVNLLPLLGAHHSLAGRTLALLPAAKPALQTWQVAFDTKSTAPAAARITAQVSYRIRAATQPVPSTAPVASVPSAPVPSAPGPVPPMPAPGAATAPVNVGAAPPVVAPVTIAAHTTLIKGGRYGLVWAVPLGLLLLGWLVGSTATRDLRSLGRD
ncbi:MAG TPA: hypothetical protein VHC43_11960 [Mycobacteriales bacterium]|nr:hypothetical protein [Mycobacteriales bacterium]